MGNGSWPGVTHHPHDTPAMRPALRRKRVRMRMSGAVATTRNAARRVQAAGVAIVYGQLEPGRPLTAGVYTPFGRTFGTRAAAERPGRTNPNSDGDDDCSASLLRRLRSPPYSTPVVVVDSRMLGSWLT